MTYNPANVYNCRFSIYHAAHDPWALCYSILYQGRVKRAYGVVYRKQPMLARVLPQGDDACIVYELTQMGHPHPEATLATHRAPDAIKLIGMPQATAIALTAWLRQWTEHAWWHSAPGAVPDTVDLILAGRNEALPALQQAAGQTPALQAVVMALQQAWNRQEEGPTHLTLGSTSWQLQQRMYVMGILNITPDSFSDGGLYLQPEQALKHAEAMLAEGADIIDVGGQSSRPGAVPVPAPVEQARVVPVVQDIVKRFGALVSVDTYRASVAVAALDAGAVLINDISAMGFDAQMAPLIARRGAAVVLMHMQGTPQTMQRGPTYRHVLDEVYSFLATRLDMALQAGIARHRMVLDPGFGFGKTIHHDLELLRGLKQFQALGQPLLIGTSRKSFLGRLLRQPLWDRLGDTLATVVYGVMQGAAIVRVHDVAQVVQAVRLLEVLRDPSVMPRFTTLPTP